MLLDHGMSLLVIAIFFFLLFADARERKKRKKKKRNRSPPNRCYREEAEFFADWLVQVYMMPEGMIGRKQRTDAYRKEKYT
jgi:hypothetical protein